MEKNKFVGKTYEEALENAKLSLQESEENLIVKELEEVKGGLFKSKKIEIEVIEKREVNQFIKDYISKLVNNIGLTCNIEMKKENNSPSFTLYTSNDAVLIGKNGKNLQALTTVVAGAVKNEIDKNYKFTIDINSYKEKQHKNLEYLAKKLAREVKETKIEVKMDSMNSYERRIIHNTLTNNKYVITTSEGEEPNRYVVIKPKED